VARTVWKFPIRMQARQEVLVGDNPRIVHVGEQHDQPCIWVDHDPQPEHTAKVRLAFEIVGTGHRVPSSGKHVGTFMVDGGTFVFHVYDLGPVDDDPMPHVSGSAPEPSGSAS